jgi:hypothetical protein
MTVQQIFAIEKLKACVFPVGSGHKRFARDMHHQSQHAPERPLTPRQEVYLAKLLYSYRRQHKLPVIIEW